MYALLAGLLFFWDMKKTLMALLLLCSLEAISQISKTITEGYAYYLVPMPGTIPVDGEGNPDKIKRDTVYTVIVAVHGKNPDWAGAWIGNRYFSIAKLSSKKGQIVAGKRFSDEKPIVINSVRDSIYQFQLMTSETIRKPSQKIKPGEVLLEGKVNGKSFSYRILNSTQLASPMYQ